MGKISSAATFFSCAYYFQSRKNFLSLAYGPHAPGLTALRTKAYGQQILSFYRPYGLMPTALRAYGLQAYRPMYSMCIRPYGPWASGLTALRYRALRA